MAGLHCGGTSAAAVLPWLLQPWGGQGSPSGHWDQFHTWDLQRKHARREQPGSGKETKAVPHASGTQGLLWCHATQDLSVQHPVNPPPFPWGDSSYSYGV